MSDTEQTTTPSTYNHARRKARAVIAKLLLQLAEDERPTLRNDREPKAFRDEIAVKIEAIDLLRDELRAWASESTEGEA
jgi:hypothetical protein